MKLLVLLALVPLTVQFPKHQVQRSGYGDNNEHEVQHAAGGSPHNKPVDYTSATADDSPKQVGPGSKVGNQVDNGIKNQQAGSDLTTKENAQTNKRNQNANLSGGNQKAYTGSQSTSNNKQTTNQNVNNNVGQENSNYHPVTVNQGVNVPTPVRSMVYDVVRPYTFPKGEYIPANGGMNMIGNLINAQTLGQANTQGQASAQIGGAQTNVGQVNNQGGATGPYKPSYDTPTYAAILIPSYNGVGNKIYSQGQQNVQKGGDQTNVGVNNNQANVGQAKNQGGAAGYRPSYDTPTYAAVLIPNYNVIGNKFNVQNPGQGGAAGYRPSYDTPAYAVVLIPNYFTGNKVDTQTLGQANNQGQVSVQKGGDQTNVGSNANAVNVGQVNNQLLNGCKKLSYKDNIQRKTGTGPSYDAPRRGGPVTAVGNKGGDQANISGNFNTVNVSQTNNQNVNGQKQSDSGSSYRKRS
ncbi:hypothetical protein ANCCAN_05906 [Ancylostoma caninum]|uniref:Uncharacterized protein n=1 Tax=Ancylostoma caninum TaxID=29170 RepID=A0A368GYL2_ANCCA|nr:hypothetical protein ANCCAN_05906 [Ancylostoma caninum]